MSKKTAKSTDTCNLSASDLIAKLLRDSNPEEYDKAKAKAAMAMAVKLAAAQDPVAREAGLRLALVKAQDRLEVQRRTRTSRIKGKLADQLEMVVQVSLLSPEEQKVLKKGPAYETVEIETIEIETIENLPEAADAPELTIQ